MQKKNQIQAYSFGSINVNGETYTQDIIIYPKKLKTNWRRERGHILNTADIKEIIEYKPTVLVLGTGKMGVLKVDSEVEQELKKADISLIKQRTDQACQTFNQLIKEGKKVVGAFHLTC